jgi:hypothetical protein
VANSGREFLPGFPNSLGRAWLGHGRLVQAANTIAHFLHVNRAVEKVHHELAVKNPLRHLKVIPQNHRVLQLKG